jgi:hypothetical protein
MALGEVFAVMAAAFAAGFCYFWQVILIARTPANPWKMPGILIKSLLTISRLHLSRSVYILAFGLKFGRLN